jgi:hypothetical protein
MIVTIYYTIIEVFPVIHIWMNLKKTFYNVLSSIVLLFHLSKYLNQNENLSVVFSRLFVGRALRICLLKTRIGKMFDQMELKR